ncbi:MAG: TIGR04076 family protein [Alphaproteobacteria bacterium]
MADDEFTIYDLKVEWLPGEKPCWCGAKDGDHFTLEGENIHFPPGQSWSIYTLATLIPLLPAKQRVSHPNDWMTTDTDIACPDPNCGSRFRISQTVKRTFRHSETTAMPLAKPKDDE